MADFSPQAAVPQVIGSVNAVPRCEIVAAAYATGSVLAECHSKLLAQIAGIETKLGAARHAEAFLKNVPMIGSGVDRSALPDTADLAALDEIRKRLTKLAADLGSAAEFVIKLQG